MESNLGSNRYKRLLLVVLVGTVVIGFAGLYYWMNSDKLQENVATNNASSKSTINVQNDEADKNSPKTSKTLNQPLFDEIPAEITGVSFTHRLLPDHPRAYLYNSGYPCGGVCLGDVNGDGWLDIFLVSGPDDNALFLNKKGFTFEKSSASKILADSGSWGVGAGMVDIEGDGDLDIYVCNYDSPNRLWMNEGLDSSGQPRFKEIGSESGLHYTGPSLAPYFTDFDVDGDLDFFLLTNRLLSPTGRPRGVASELGPDKRPRVKKEFEKNFRVVLPDSEVPSESGTPPGPFLLEYGHEDRLYRNEGTDKEGVPIFTDVTDGSGIEGVIGHGLSALIWDINRDRLPDIYVANDYTDKDYLWLNAGLDENKKFRFRDATEDFLPYTTWSSMGSDIADVDGDGLLDFFVADMSGTTHFKAKSTMGEMNGWRRWVMEHGWPRQSMRNMLFIDSGEGRFKEAAFLAGIASSDWSWGAKFADFDLDGKSDLFITNGAARVFSDSDIFVKPSMLIGKSGWEIFKKKPEMHEKNFVFRNNGNMEFTEVGSSWNLDKEGMSYGVATGDLDGDGDLDLVVCNLKDQVSLYRNRATESGAHWLRVQLEGSGKNRNGLGAHVTVKLFNGMKLVRLMNPHTGFLCTNEPLLHFGLGEVQEIDYIEVLWPTGEKQILNNPSVDQLIVIRQENSTTPKSPETLIKSNQSEENRFREVASEIGLKFKHKEIPYDDFRNEFLLPGKLSQFGSGLAVADINNDGLDDVFVGGAAGQAGKLFIHQQDHTFIPLEKAPWDTHLLSEDMGALFFDADRDGDLDLYVVHGSNQWNLHDRPYEDKLYINLTEPGSSVRFTQSISETIPAMSDSGSCVVGADYDRDGDVDLFIGARSIPWKYPLTPNSTLLRNDGQHPGEVKFTDVTDSVSSELRQVGLVTGALWSDIDGDRLPDLLVSCEWGPVRIFLNKHGKLEESTAEAGMSEHLGWWNAITGADFDGDGDIDYAALNVGYNTKYGRPSNTKPTSLYRRDMDGNGVVDLVEAKSSSEGELPIRGRSCSCQAMPQLRNKFPTYKKFALSNLSGIYSEQQLNAAYKVTANEFASGIWINESTPGKPRLTWQALPTEAQLSPCYGAVAADFFGDGRPALALAQNLYTREPETGLWRGGLGCVIRSENKNSILQDSDRAGFMIAGDGKALGIIDLNADGNPDIVGTQNNDSLLAFLQHRQSSKKTTNFSIRLQGPPGNPLGFGAKITIYSGETEIKTSEIHAGSGYLSQSSSAAFFSVPKVDKPYSIKVLWPTGEESTATIKPEQPVLIISAPLNE